MRQIQLRWLARDPLTDPVCPQGLWGHTQPVPCLRDRQNRLSQPHSIDKETEAQRGLGSGWALAEAGFEPRSLSPMPAPGTPPPIMPILSPGAGAWAGGESPETGAALRLPPHPCWAPLLTFQCPPAAQPGRPQPSAFPPTLEESGLNCSSPPVGTHQTVQPGRPAGRKPPALRAWDGGEGPPPSESPAYLGGAGDSSPFPTLRAAHAASPLPGIQCPWDSRLIWREEEPLAGWPQVPRPALPPGGQSQEPGRGHLQVLLG